MYRRLQTLYDAKLLAISGSINDDGKKYFLYKSRVKSISLKCDLEVTTIEIVPNSSHGWVDDSLIFVGFKNVERKFRFKTTDSYSKKRIY